MRYIMIGSVREYGTTLEIYDEDGNKTGSIPLYDGLVGYTSTTISVKSGSFTLIFDEYGLKKDAY